MDWMDAEARTRNGGESKARGPDKIPRFPGVKIEQKKTKGTKF